MTVLRQRNSLIGTQREIQALGVLDAGDVSQEEMKAKRAKEFFHRIRSILKSKLNGANVLVAINERAVSLLIVQVSCRYGS